MDAEGSYQTREGKTVKVNGARELATLLAGREETHSAFAEQLLHHLAAIAKPVARFLSVELVDAGFW